MYCKTCGATVEPTANFCTKCGSRLSPPSGRGAATNEPSSLGQVCASLVSELDSARQGWLSVVNNFISSATGAGLSIVNPEFSEELDIGTIGDDEPAMFIFKTVNGVTAEATVMAWQIESAVGFANSQKYIREDQGHEFLNVLTEAVSSPPRILAMRMVLFSFETQTPINDESMAIVLSHYLMNERGRSPSVLQLYEKLLNPLITYLQGFTYLGTSRVFGDPETVARIQKTLGF